ncbi:MAG: hypothetical protein K9H26_17445 [Prolixibacteraceae bacterium]|nr:hypothetical protein [Prolixibacteraceae bacterium]
MKTNSKIFSILLAIFSFLNLNSYSQDLDTINIELDDAIIREGMKKYLNQIPEGKEASYGFNNRQEFSEVSYGEPLCFFTLSNDFKTSYTVRKEHPFYFDHEWFLPLTINNKARCFLFLNYENDKLSVIGIGGLPVCEELSQNEAWNPSEEGKNGLLFIYELGEKFILKNSISGLEIHPIGNTRKRLKPEKRKYFQKCEFIDKIFLTL